MSSKRSGSSRYSRRKNADARFREGCLRIRHRLGEIKFAIVLWGPRPESDSLLASLRDELRSHVNDDGHKTYYPEELVQDDDPHFSVLMQEEIQAICADLIVAIHGSAGSLVEIHAIADEPGISRKTIVIVDRKHKDGFAMRSLEAKGMTLVLHTEEARSETIAEVLKWVRQNREVALRELLATERRSE